MPNYPPVLKIPPARLFLLYTAITAGLFNLVFTVNTLYYITVAHLDPLQLVLVGTILEGSVFLLEVPTGVVADAFSRRLSILIGIFLIGCGFILEGSLPVFGAILAAQVLWGGGYTFTSGALQAWITDETSEEIAANLLIRAIRYDQLGGLAGVLLGSALGLVRINLPILLGGGAFILFAIFLAFSMSENGFRPSVERNNLHPWKKFSKTLNDGVHTIRRRPTLLGILAVGLVMGLYSEGIDRLWNAFLLQETALPALIQTLPPVLWFGVINVVTMLLTTLAGLAAERLEGIHNPRKLIQLQFIFNTGIIGALLCLVFSHSFTMAILSLLAIYILRRISDPLYTIWVNQRLDSNTRATILSLSSQANAVGQISGGPLVGWIASAYSIRTGLLTSTGLLLPILGLLGFQINRTPSQPED